MTLSLRPYQTEAIEALFDYWASEPGNPLIDLATGTGKAFVQAASIQRLITDYPDMRFMSATHVEELVSQNFAELVGIWPWAPAGIYAASLGRRDAHSQIIFASVHTVYNKTARIGHIDVLFIDEAHLVGRDANSKYGKLIAGLRAINPDLKIVGLSATVYRLDSGRLDEGDDRIFDKVVYEYGIAQGVAEGYLTRPATPGNISTRIDLTGVRTLAGEYKKSDLAAAVDRYETTRAAVQEICAYGERRKTWLIFGAGIEHVEHIRDEIRSYGISCESITSKTQNRSKIIEAYKGGKIRAITSDVIMTTGTNVKGIDLIADLAPTKSTSRYVQKIGRMTRPLYARGYDLDTLEGRLAAIAAGPKPNALYLDFARNADYHGPVDDLRIRKPGKGDGEAPFKLCPECMYLCNASARRCAECDHEFPVNEQENIKAKPSVAPILSSAEPEWLTVTGRGFRYHDKPGGTDSVRVDFGCGFVTHKMWVCPEHKGFAKQKADRFWAQHGGAMPAPKGVQEWIDRGGELRPTEAISVRPSGRYFEVVGVRPAVEMKEAA